MTTRVKELAGLGLLLAIVAILYAPGVHSGYFLDDYFNLRQLGEVPEAGYTWFVFGGVAGPTGRPLSLLTFALQHGAWPYHAWAFKAVNIVLHLAAGVLVFLFARMVSAKLFATTERVTIFAFSACALWLLLPMHVDTVLYVIQRMTELSAFFILAGLCGFVLGRTRYPQWGARRSYLVMSVSVVVGTAFALFSKENGVLLPLYACVTDFTLLQDIRRPPRYRIWRALFLLLPVIVVAGYLIFNLGAELHGYTARTYSPWQRLITESRVLTAYLYDLILPRPGAFTLFHDDFTISQGLLSPPGTLLASAFIALLLGFAVVFRRRAPVFSFAVMWFFGGHVLESTFLNLDVYFEHRNYLPSLGVVFLLVWVVLKVQKRGSLRIPVALAAIVYCSLVGAVTWQTVQLWTQPLVQAKVWMDRHPQSTRTIVNLENMYIIGGNIDAALGLLDWMERQFPDQIYPDLKRISILACVQDKPISDNAWRIAERKAASGTREEFSNIGELATLIPALITGDCPHVDHFRLVRLIETLAHDANPRDRRGALYELAATLALRFGDISEGYGNLVRAVQASPTMHRRVYLLEVTLALRLPAVSSSVYSDVKRAMKKNPLAYIAYRKTMRKLERELAALQQAQHPQPGSGGVGPGEASEPKAGSG